MVYEDARDFSIGPWSEPFFFVVLCRTTGDPRACQGVLPESGAMRVAICQQPGEAFTSAHNVDILALPTSPEVVVIVVAGAKKAVQALVPRWYARPTHHRLPTQQTSAHIRTQSCWSQGRCHRFIDMYPL